MLSVSRTVRAITMAASVACYSEKGAIEPTIPPEDAVRLNMTMSPEATIMAVGDTRQLTIDVRTLTGVPVTEFDTVHFWLPTPADTARIRLSPTGLVTAVSPGTQLRVWAYVKIAGHGYAAAWSMFQVTQTEVAGAALSIQPTDSTRLAAASLKIMAATLENPSTGQAVANPLVRFSVKPEDADRLLVHKPTLFTGALRFQVNPNGNPAVNQIRALEPESSVWVYGTVDAFGAVLRDSVLMTITYPFTIMIPVAKTVGALTSAFHNRTITLAAGAAVTFRNSVSPSTDQLRIAYTFDNPAAATAATPTSTVGGSSGDVSALNAGQQSARRFMTPGTYRWTATASGGPAPWPGQTLSGTIVIK